MLKVLLILIFFKHNFAIETNFNGKTLKFDKFLDPCPNEEDVAGNYSISNLKTVGSNLLFDITVYFDHLLEKGDLEINFERCLSKEALDTCKLVQKLKTKNGCMLLVAKKQVWSSMISCLEPKMECPIQKGFYSGTGCSLDFSFFNYIPLGRYYWRTQGRLVSPKVKKTLLCFTFAGQIIKK